jgi:antitoxin VapB
MSAFFRRLRGYSTRPSFLFMITLSEETEALAKRLVAAQRLSIEDAIREALEDKARIAGIVPKLRRRRMTVEEMLAVGSEIAAMPLLDKRSPREIMDDLDALPPTVRP